MTREAFAPVNGVNVRDLLLDVKNPRIRAGTDQPDCIERLLRKPKQMLALARDIATNGLSTAPILVQPKGKRQYVVWDGNRRVTALKILNDPSLCRNKALQAQFVGIAARATYAIPSKIDVLASSDTDALLKEVLARHAGALEGAGQLTWDALLRTMFLLGHKAPTDYRLAGELLLWAEEHGVEVADTFPITTIHRFLNKRNLGKLGFRDDGDSVQPTISEDDAVRVVERVVEDFGGGRIDVNDIYDQTGQDKYINSLLVEFGLAQKDQGHAKDGDDDAAGDDSDPKEDKPPPRRRRAGAGPTKPSWDRKSIVPTGFKPDFPDEMWKAEEVLRELRRLETLHSPIAAAALFRMFFELSVRAYARRHRVTQEDKMHKTALAVAAHMRAHGRIDQGELDAASRRLKDRSQSGETLLQYATLNDYMHSFKALPDRQSLHVLWTELNAFLEACWNDARRPR